MLPIPKIFEKINHQQEEPPTYLALMVGPRKVKSGIWVFEEGRGKVLAFGSTEEWSGDSPEELIVSADTSIASAVAKLSEISNQQPNKVVLGLPANWVDGSTVKEPQTKILQTICRKLLLRAEGFVVNPEAITHYLKNKEGDLISVILVDLQESEVTVLLIVQGKFLGTQTVSRSDNLALDLEEGLIRFNYTNPLPPRIMLIDAEESEEAKQTLIAYLWVSPEKQKKISFLQLPKVDLAPENLEVEAVVFAGSLEIFPGKIGKAVLPEKKPEYEEEVKQPEPSFELPEENFGFVKGEDIVSEPDVPVVKKQPAVTEIDYSPEPETKKFKFPFKKMAVIKKVPVFFGNLLKKFPKKISLPGFKLPKKGFLIFGILLFLILGFFIFAYLKIVKAEVNILVQPLVLDKEISFTVSDKITEPDFNKKILPSMKMTHEVAGIKSMAVEGRKTVGDKATGEVVIFNGTDKDKTFPKQTTILGSDGLKFVLAEEVTIQKRTTDINSTPPVDRWGEGKVGVVAVDIGTEYNFPANANLSIDQKTGTSSAFLVRNPNEFSGGSSREISAVSKLDKETLLKNLLQELEVQAEGELKAKVPENSFLPDSFKLERKTEKYDHETDDEASELTLEENAVYSILYFDKETITSLVKDETDSQIPEGFESEPVKQDLSFNLEDKTKNSYVAFVSSQHYPLVAQEEISLRLRGKLVSRAEKILKETKNTLGYEIKITPKTFMILPFMPLNNKNIVVRMSSI